jgi:hypothetical protein
MEFSESVARVGTDIVEKLSGFFPAEFEQISASPPKSKSVGLIAFSQISIMEPSILLSPFFAKAASSITTRL